MQPMRIAVLAAGMIGRRHLSTILRRPDLVELVGAVDPSQPASALPDVHAPFFRVVAVNLLGTFNLMSHCAAAMMKNAPSADGERGVVINTSSGAAFEGQVGQSAYAASKAALVGLTLPAARELSRHGIRVNAIAPGLFDTPMAQGAPELLQPLTALIEFPKRLGDSAEFASLCAHICGNRYLNGECIRLDAATCLRAR